MECWRTDTYSVGVPVCTVCIGPDNDACVVVGPHCNVVPLGHMPSCSGRIFDELGSTTDIQRRFPWHDRTRHCCLPHCEQQAQTQRDVHTVEHSETRTAFPPFTTTHIQARPSDHPLDYARRISIPHVLLDYPALRIRDS